MPNQGLGPDLMDCISCTVVRLTSALESILLGALMVVSVPITMRSTPSIPRFETTSGRMEEHVQWVQ